MTTGQNVVSSPPEQWPFIFFSVLGRHFFFPSLCHGCQYTLFLTGIPPTAAAYTWHGTMRIMSTEYPHKDYLNLQYVQALAFWTPNSYFKKCVSQYMPEMLIAEGGSNI